MKKYSPGVHNMNNHWGARSIGNIIVKPPFNYNVHNMIVILANQFIGDNISTGGDVLFLEICRRLKNKKVILIPSGPAGKIKDIFKDNEVVVTDYGKNLDTASTFLGAIFTIYRYLIRSINSAVWLMKNSEKIDTVYLTGDFICNTLPAAIYKFFHPRVKILANFYHRNPSPENRPGNPYLVSYFSRLLQGISLQIMKLITDTTYVLSEIGRDELLKEGFRSSSVVVSGAGVTKTRKTTSIVKKNNQIVFIGRINITKGAFDLIKIFHQVVRQNKKINLIMVGGASDVDKIRLTKLIGSFSLADKVKYLGFVGEETKYKILSKSKALVLPSKEEGFGIVVMEALSCNTPVICYDLPALKAVYSKYESVHFVKSFNKDMFFRKIIDLISKNTVDHFEKVQTWDKVYQTQSRYFR